MTMQLSNEEQVLLQQAIDESFIPENSPTVLLDTISSRFSSAEWYNKVKEKKVILAGLGGIGSYVGYLLSRVHVKDMILYDSDIVEEQNMSGQFYNKCDIGKHKTDALIAKLQDYSNTYYDCVSRNYTVDSIILPIMICGFDNMEARKTFFKNWLVSVSEARDKSNCLFIDGRLAAEEFQVFCIKGDDERNIKRYEEEFLFTDAEADATICSYKQTSFCANMIASVMVNLFVNFCANQCNPLIERDLPFLTEYNGVTMYFKTTT